MNTRFKPFLWRVVLVFLLVLPMLHTADNPDLYQLNVYRDIFSSPLSDWAASGGRPRSPRFVFGKADPITVEVIVNNNVGSAVSVEVVNTTSIDEVTVSCEYSSALSSANHHVYRASSANYLFLVPQGASGSSGKPIGVVDEELLKFTIVGHPDVTKTYMVDRGERASGGAVFYGGASGDQSVCLFSQWDENGNRDFGNAMTTPAQVTAARAFLNHAGDYPASGQQADLLHWSSHGGYDGSLGDNGTLFSYSPISDGVSWNGDVEYVINAACNTLNASGNPEELWVAQTSYAVGDRVEHAGNIYSCTTAGVSGNSGPSGQLSPINDGTVVWQFVSPVSSSYDAFSGFTAWSLMIDGAHRAHGILGAAHPLDGNLVGQFSAFYSQLIAGGTYFSSFSGGLSSGTPQPWAMIIAPEYRLDKFKEAQQDGYTGHVLVRAQ